VIDRPCLSPLRTCPRQWCGNRRPVPAGKTQEEGSRRRPGGRDEQLRLLLTKDFVDKPAATPTHDAAPSGGVSRSLPVLIAQEPVSGGGRAFREPTVQASRDAL